MLFRSVAVAGIAIEGVVATAVGVEIANGRGRIVAVNGTTVAATAMRIVARTVTTTVAVTAMRIAPVARVRPRRLLAVVAVDVPHGIAVCRDCPSRRCSNAVRK